jgi:hypothetical protein
MLMQRTVQGLTCRKIRCQISVQFMCPDCPKVGRLHLPTMQRPENRRRFVKSTADRMRTRNWDAAWSSSWPGTSIWSQNM